MENRGVAMKFLLFVSAFILTMPFVANANLSVDTTAIHNEPSVVLQDESLLSLKNRLSGKWVLTNVELILDEKSNPLLENDQWVFNTMKKMLSVTVNPFSSLEWVLHVDDVPSDCILGLKTGLVPCIKIKDMMLTDMKFVNANQVKIITYLPIGGLQSWEDELESFIQSYKIMTPESLQQNPDLMALFKEMLSASIDVIPVKEYSSLGATNRDELLAVSLHSFFTDEAVKSEVINSYRKQMENLRKMVSSSQNKLHEIQDREILLEEVSEFQLASDGDSFTLTGAYPGLEYADASIVPLLQKTQLKTTYRRAN